MKEIKGFTGSGNWYKGNLHCHTTNSDGALTPREVVALYKQKGYSFLCLSEHDVYTDLTPELNEKDFILLPGVETAAYLLEDRGGGLRKKAHHIHGIAGTAAMQAHAGQKPLAHGETLPTKLFYGAWDGQKIVQDMVDGLIERGCFTTYNHPIWSKVNEADFISTEHVWALEIYNYSSHLENYSGYDTTYWDAMLRNGRHILGFASDDNHNSGIPHDSGGGYVVVRAETLSADCLIDNLLKGNFYSSAGPEIHDFGIRDGVVYVDCSRVYRIDFIAGNVINDGVSVVSDEYKDKLCYGEYHLKGHESYVRIECTDKYGRKAWTNPIFLQDESSL